MINVFIDISIDNGESYKFKEHLIFINLQRNLYLTLSLKVVGKPYHFKHEWYVFFWGVNFFIKNKA